MQPTTYYLYEVYILDAWNRMFGYEVIKIDEKLEEEGYPLELGDEPDHIIGQIKNGEFV